MAFESGGARIIKEERKGISARLGARDISMLFILAIVAVSALIAYFVLFPMYTSLSSLSKEIDGLKAQESEYSGQIAKAGEYRKVYDDALDDYNTYISCFHTPMDPETIDKRVTGMLIRHGMKPVALSMTDLAVEAIPAYTAEGFRDSPAAEAEKEPQASPEGTGGTSKIEQAAEEAAAYEEPAQEPLSDCYVFAYTVKASASGSRESLYSFLAQAATMTSTEVTSFSYTSRKAEQPAEEKPAAEKPEDGAARETAGSIVMEIKLYVFVKDVTARDFAAK